MDRISKPSDLIHVIFCNVNSVNATDMNHMLGEMPYFMQQEINRYRSEIDRKTRLVARVMLLKQLICTGASNRLKTWERSTHGKPFIKDWDHFSISHSGNYVVLCHGMLHMGVDIEEEKIINLDDVMPFLSGIEHDVIQGSTDRLRAFYKNWVKKEAFLKAIGKGLCADVDLPHLGGNYVSYDDENWHFYPLDLANGFTSYICSRSDAASFNFFEFDGTAMRRVNY